MQQAEQRIRGFEAVSAFKHLQVNLPRRQTHFSAAYDIESLHSARVLPGKTVVLETGVKAYMLPDEVLVLAIRSSKGIKEGLALANSVAYIDADYYNNESNEGHILIAVRNCSDQTREILAGERVAQGMFLKYLVADGDEPVAKNRAGGIGHTG